MRIFEANNVIYNALTKDWATGSVICVVYPITILKCSRVFREMIQRHLLKGEPRRSLTLIFTGLEEPRAVDSDRIWRRCHKVFLRPLDSKSYLTIYLEERNQRCKQYWSPHRRRLLQRETLSRPWIFFLDGLPNAITWTHGRKILILSYLKTHSKLLYTAT
jgi:hypothetical protein